MRSYFPVGEKGPSDRLQKRVVDKYIALVLKSKHPAETRGYALALGSLPKKLLAPSKGVLDAVLSCLYRKSRHTSKVGREGDAETRRNCLQALQEVVQTVGFATTSSPPAVGLSQEQTSQTFDAMLTALNDYNTDRRGDVGSWSRMAAMSGLEALTCLVVQQHEELLTKQLCVDVVGGLLKQLSEKLDAVRLYAGQCLERMLQFRSPPIPWIPCREILEGSLGINNVDETNWADAGCTFPMMAKVLQIDDFFYQVMSGMVISVGALTENVTKHSEEALLDWIRDVQGNGASKKERASKFGKGKH